MSGRAHAPGLLVLAAAVGLAACGQRSGTFTSATLEVHGDRSEATLIGRDVRIEVAGDTLEVKDGLLLLNGAPCGGVPAGDKVRYVVEPAGRTLSVDGMPREPAR
jgi:hypothetical protein